MLKWISKIFGGRNLPADVPQEWAEHLEKLFKSVDSLPNVRSGVANDMFNYVVNGDSLAVLHEVGQYKEIAEHLCLSGYSSRDWFPILIKFYAAFSAVPTAMALRYALLLEACIRSSSHYNYLQFPNGVKWPEVLLMQCTNTRPNQWTSGRVDRAVVSIKWFERLLVEASLDAHALLVSAFTSSVTAGYGAARELQLVTLLDDYADALDRYAEQLRPLMQPALVQQRLHVLKMLEKAAPTTLDKFAPELAELAVSSSKQVRAAAEERINDCGNAIVQPLQHIACHGKSEQRLWSLKLLHALAVKHGDASLLQFVQDTARADAAPSVVALNNEWSSSPSAATEHQQQGLDYQVPVIALAVTLTPQIKTLVTDMWNEINKEISVQNAHNAEHHKRMKASGYRHSLQIIDLLSVDEQKKLMAHLASSAPLARTKNRSGRSYYCCASGFKKLASDSACTPMVLFKVLDFFDFLVNEKGLFESGASPYFNTLYRTTGSPTLLELSQMLDDSGYSGSSLLQNYCYYWGDTLANDWAEEAVWPFFAHNLESVVKLLTSSQTNSYSFSRARLFSGIASLPSTPLVLCNSLFELALGSGKSDRRAAQDALFNFPDKVARIISALTDGKSETRAIAAQWLSRLGETAAIPALETAVLKEKQDLAKGAMLDALQLMGQPIEKYLKRDALADEAAKLLKKGLPKELDWFPWAALPEVRWADNQELVPVDVLRWMMAQAVKQKSAEPNAVLRKYCGMFEPRDRVQFGQMVLDTWLSEDTRPISPDDALKNATAHAQSMYNYMQQYPQHFQNDPSFGLSVAELTAKYLPNFLQTPAGSANASKGLLAIVSACAADGVVAPTSRYLKQWYGTRAAQGKALIAMLAWIEHPSATQLMLSIGNRFRTKSFQEEATKQAEALAERKGWTLSELADRTMPSAGFDENGVLELNYGQRIFTARLLPDFKVELYNPDGKKIAALPEARLDDDAEQVKDAKKAFSASKKELKSIVALQAERLYESMCIERDWSFEDWQLYLNQHPVVRHLVQRLVWSHCQDGKVVSTFRPLDDGTLTDCEDNELKLASDARIRIAHDSLLSTELIAQWQQHLADYEITPLFQQLGKGVYQLPTEKTNSDQIKDFEGHLIEAFSLRGRALKLGYTRGAAEDGGWFHVYSKRFPTLGLQAVIEFTGNPLPEENRTVALLNLAFTSAESGSSWQNNNLSLAKVPKVLLSECYNDLRLIAADGSGFDPEWQKKSEY